MLLEFVRNLLSGDQVRVGSPAPIPAEDRRDTADLLVEFERDYRISLPGDPPPLDLEAALWSAVSIYHAASLVVHRNYGAETIDSVLGTKAPDRSKAESHYAVDLTMRFLPDLLKLAKSASTNDPLVERLMDWATAWPLSSVAIPVVEVVDAAPLRTSPTLMRLYADRVIAAGNHSRLDDPAVAEVVRSVLGSYPELCPSIARELDIP